MKRFIKNIFYNKKLKSKKREGFTLIELMSVMAIIAILLSIMLPKFSGYIMEAKKTKVIDQCRKVVMAVESYNLICNKQLGDNITINDDIAISDAMNKGLKKYLEDIELNNINDNATIGQCRDILKGAEFSLDENAKMVYRKIS